MNFLLRNTHPVTPLQTSAPEIEPHKDMQPMAKPVTTLGGLIAEDQYTNSSASEDGDKEIDGVGDESGKIASSSLRNQTTIGSHFDVAEDEGWITIPNKALPEDWTDTSDILQLRSLDRSFVFPGEQLHILVCLTAAKQDNEVITPFKVAAVISKNGGSTQKVKQPMEILENKSTSIIAQEGVNGTHEGTGIQGLQEENDEAMSTPEKVGYKHDISATKSLLRMEDHKQKTETLLERFRNSNFFVRVTQSDEPLWSRRNASDSSSPDSEGVKIHSTVGGSSETSKRDYVNAVIDRGTFDGNTSGGAARSTARCYSLHNGDIVVLLQVNIASTSMKDPVLEVLQFEKYNATVSSSENLNGLVDDPCRDLLHWLLPLDRALPPPRPLSPPLKPTSVLASASQRATPVSSSSQIFSFGNFRSYSMSALPQVSPVTPNTKTALDNEDVDRFSVEKLTKSQDTGNESLLSFRGVPLEPERFSVHCGLEGIYLPGRRWRRKLDIIQPIEIHSFVADCATEDLLCLQIKNVSPASIPDIVIYLDAITIVFEEASKGGPPLSLPIASIEAGNGHSLPNLALRRGEEHSFILKPATTPAATVATEQKGPNSTKSLLSRSKVGVSAPDMHLVSREREGRRLSPSSDQYAILVSCRCNYTESKLFFMKPTSWRPRIARDLIISVASEISKQTVGPNDETPQLPVQVLTLQASNLTSEDLTLTVVAPISSNSSPSIMSLNSGPTSPMSPFFGFPEFPGKLALDKQGTALQRLSSLPTAHESQKDSEASEKRSIYVGARPGTSDVISSTDMGCTHLWLQSTVPLGCIPARSNATVKLELLPLTDGIITLDTLQVAVKDKGLMYTPEKPLRIFVAPAIATGVV